MNKKLLWIVVVLIAASLACGLPFMGSGDETSSGSTNDDNGLPGADTDTYDVSVKNAALLEPVELSPAQRQVLTVKGPPNRFTLTFSDEMREECWYYDHLGYQVTFRNGDTYTEDNAGTPVDAAGIVSIYYPWQFNGQMGLSELLTVSETESFAVESLEEAFQEDMSIVYLKGLDVGFRGGKILYIRSIPIGEGAREMAISVEVVETIEAEEVPEEAETESEPVSFEEVHAGTHIYQMTCIYSDGTSEDVADETTWEFKEDGLYFNGDGPFPKIAENYYGLQDETGGFFFMFTRDNVVISGSFVETDDNGDDSILTFSCTLIQE